MNSRAEGITSGENVRDGELDAFPLGLGTEDVGVRRALEGHLGLVLLQAIEVGAVTDQAHGQLVGLQKDLVGIGLLLGHGVAESLETILADDTGIGEPLAVGFDSGNRGIPRLIFRRLDDLAVGIPLSLPILPHVQGLDLLRIAIEVLALDLDIVHARAGLALTDKPVTFLLAGPHGCAAGGRGKRKIEGRMRRRISSHFNQVEEVG